MPEEHFSANLTYSRQMPSTLDVRTVTIASTSTSSIDRSYSVRSVCAPGLGRVAVTSAFAFFVALTPSVAVAAPPPPPYSGVDPGQSAFIKGLVEKSQREKAALDEERLNNFYKRDYAINKLLGAEVLAEPCDPRDPEFGWQCRPTLTRLPQDRLSEFDEPERAKTGFGLVRSAGEVDAAADALVTQEMEIK